LGYKKLLKDLTNYCPQLFQSSQKRQRVRFIAHGQRPRSGVTPKDCTDHSIVIWVLWQGFWVDIICQRVNLEQPRIPAPFTPIMKCRLGLTGWRVSLPLEIVDMSLSLGAFFIPLTFSWFWFMGKAAWWDVHASLLLKAPGVFGVCPKGFLCDPSLDKPTHWRRQRFLVCVLSVKLFPWTPSKGMPWTKRQRPRFL
jgi:hypothetical protein